MSGGWGSILGAVAPIAGGFLGAGLGELGGELFGSTASSLLTPTMLADIGGAVGGAGAGALANPNNRGMGAALGGLTGAFTGPGLTNWAQIPQGLGEGAVTPLWDSLFNNAGWGRGTASPTTTGYTLGSAGGGAGAAAAGGIPLATTGATQSAAAGVPLTGAPVAPGTAGGGGAGGVGGTGLSPAQLLAMLGIGGAALSQGQQNLPNQGQLTTLANQAMGNAAMANSLRSGRLPPGAEQMAEASLASSEADIRGRYAAMGLSGSTMEAQDIASAQQQNEAMKYQMAQSASQFGLQSMNLADTIYAQIADYQLANDKSLQDALAQFASAAAGGGVNINTGGGAANTNTTLPMPAQQPTGTGP